MFALCRCEQVDAGLVSQLMQEHLSDLSIHLDSQGVSPLLACNTWLLTLFCGTFPGPTVVRFWDWLLCEVRRVVLALCESTWFCCVGFGWRTSLTCHALLVLFCFVFVFLFLGPRCPAVLGAGCVFPLGDCLEGRRGRGSVPTCQGFVLCV